jgi:hypothetical protein
MSKLWCHKKMIDMKIFKSPRRLRIEKKKRYEEREKSKQELERLNNLFRERSTKMKHLKRIEKTPKFQKDFMKMKEMFKKPEPMFNDDLNLFKTKKSNNKTDFFKLEGM